MADATATFEVELESGSVVAAANNAEEALEALEQAIFDDTRALRKMQAAMRSLKGASSASVGEINKLSDAIAAQKAKIAGAQAAYVRMGGNFERSNKKIQVSTQGSVSWIDRLLGATEGLGGKAGESAGRVRSLREGLGKLGGRAGVVGAVLTVLGVIIVGLGAKLAITAVKAADAARNFALLTKAATGSAFQGRRVAQAVEAVSRFVPTAKSDLQAMALELARAGLQGRALEDALGAAAVASSTLGAEAGGKLTELAKKAQETGKFMASASDFEGAGVSLNEVAAAMAGNLGVSFDEARASIIAGKASVEDGLDALNRAVRAKLGEAAGAQMLSFDAQMQKMRSDVSSIFEGVDVEPFLAALRDLLSMFDANTASGKALRALAKTVLQPLIDGATEAMPVVKSFFRGMLTAAVPLVAAIRKLQKWMDKIDMPGLPPIISAASAGKVVFYALAAVVGVVYAAFKLLGVAFDIVMIPFRVVARIVVGVIGLFQAIPGAASAARDAVSDLGSSGAAALGDFASSALQAGSDFVSGLIDGIIGKAGELISAVKGLAGKAVAAFKARIDSNSPSRVMAELGGFMSLGVAKGIEDEAPAAEGAMRSMLSIPTEVDSPAPSGAGRGGDSTINLTINVAPGAEKRVTEPSFIEKLCREIEHAVAMGSGGEVTV